MKTFITILSLALIGASVTAPKAQAESLGDLLKNEGLDKMLGTWVDQDTNGEQVKLVYKWKLKGHALELQVKTEDSTAVGLIVLNPGSEEPIHLSVNDKGELSQGKWSKKEGAAVLDIKRTNVDGEEAEFTIVHEPVDKNTLKIAFSAKGSDQTADITLVRAAKKKKEKKPKKTDKNSTDAADSSSDRSN